MTFIIYVAILCWPQQKRYSAEFETKANNEKQAMLFVKAQVDELLKGHKCYISEMKNLD